MAWVRMVLVGAVLAGCLKEPDADAEPKPVDASDDTAVAGDDTSAPDGDPDDADGDGYSTAVDCDDTDASINPSVAEECDGIDNNCDGAIDEGLLRSFYPDADVDGYGDEASMTEACERPDGWIGRGGDCDDSDALINPEAEEVCDEVDNDCDGEIDGPDPTGTFTFYADADGDGFGDAAVTVEACTMPAGYTSDTSDCDDADPLANPFGFEVCDGVDNDCDGSIDEASEYDGTLWYRDVDGDGYGNPAVSQVACVAPVGFVDNDDDCNDSNSAVSPDGTETCNGVDDNCSGAVDEGFPLETYYLDRDGDGHVGATPYFSCMPLSGYSTMGSDCDDDDSLVHPGMTEACNGIDDNCDGAIDETFPAITYYLDADGDGYGVPEYSMVSSCGEPEGYSTLDTDCDNYDRSIYPGAFEKCDGEDDDCDGVIDDDCTYSRNYVVFVTDNFLSTTSSTWLNSREEADEKCASYAESEGISGWDFRIMYSTPDEDARDFLDYEPGVDFLYDRFGSSIDDSDIYDGSAPTLPDMKSWTVHGSGTDGEFSECIPGRDGGYAEASWPICQGCSKQITCGSSTDAMLAPTFCCWSGTRAIMCMGETD